METKRTALTVGILFAILHALELVAIQTGSLGYMLQLHFLTIQHTVLPFNIVTAITGIVEAFIAGCVVGWAFVAIYNKLK